MGEKMKRSGLILLLACAACQQSPTLTQGEDAEVTTLSLLKEGSSRACSTDDAKGSLLDQIRASLKPEGSVTSADIEAATSSITYTIDTIAAAGVDKSIGSVSCDANVTIKHTDYNDKTYTVRYTLRPSAENDTSFVINGDYGDAAAYASNLARNSLASVMRAKAERAQADAEPAYEDDSAADESTEMNASPAPEATAPSDGTTVPDNASDASQ
jgi:hypothetical protein